MRHIFVCDLPRCSLRAKGRTDGQTEMTKLIFALINFANESEIADILKIMQRARVGSVTVYIVL
jgi:hypothetical protein